MLRTRLIAGITAGLVLSGVFATMMCMVDRFETFVEPLRVDPARPAPVALRLPPALVNASATERGVASPVGMTHVVIPRGARVSEPRLANLVRLYESSRRPPSPAALLGLWFVYFLIASMVTSYLRSFSPGRGVLLRTQVGLIGLALFLLVGSKALLLLTDLPVFLLPVAAIALWAALYLDRRTAVIVTVGLAFAAGALAGFRLSAIITFLVSGATAVATFRNRKHAWKMIGAGTVAGAAAALTVVATSSVFEGGYNVAADFDPWWRSDALAAFSGGVMSGVFAFIFQGVAVVLLGAVSRGRLVDLTDLSHPLLQKMASEAPGSWEHARAMANLAEAAATAIGADALLTRVGAYYHDLGKTCQPTYYVENLEPGEPSPHADLDPDVSADAIMAHVVEGVNILRGGDIPEPVIEFAYTHHGTSVIEYFWHKCLEQENPRGLDEAFFRYPGMRPRTKETAILMLIDSIEAASRTIDPPSVQAFEEMVQRIVFVKLKQGQLDESGLTMTDLRVITARISETLTKVHHKRIKYPWQDRKEKGEQQLPVPGNATEDDVARARDTLGKADGAVSRDSGEVKKTDGRTPASPPSLTSSSDPDATTPAPEKGFNVEE